MEQLVVGLPVQSKKEMQNTFLEVAEVEQPMEQYLDRMKDHLQLLELQPDYIHKHYKAYSPY